MALSPWRVSLLMVSCDCGIRSPGARSRRPGRPGLVAQGGRGGGRCTTECRGQRWHAAADKANTRYAHAQCRDQAALAVEDRCAQAAHAETPLFAIEGVAARAGLVQIGEQAVVVL